MKKKAIIFTAIGLALAICAGIIIFAVLGKDSREIAKNLDLGNKYLTEQNYEEAVAAFNKVLEIDPMNVDAYVGLIDTNVTHALALKGEGDFEGAYDLLNNAKEIINRAKESTGDPMFDEKLSELQKEMEVIRIEIEISNAIQEGNAYLEKYEYEKAIERFKYALSLDESRPEIYLGLVEAYIELNDFETALEWAKKGYEATGSEELKKKIEMLESGNVVDARNRRHCEYFYGEGGEFLGSIRYTYDKDRIDVVTRYSPNGEEAYSIKCEYDEEGREIFGCLGILAGSSLKIEYGESTYDEDSNVIREHHISEDGSVEYTASYEYNENGMLSKIVTENAAFGGVSTRNYSYDEKGNKIREDSVSKGHDGYETHGYQLYSYDSDGKLIEQTQYYNDEFFSKWVYTYDDDGNRVSCISYDAEGNVKSSAYFE